MAGITLGFLRYVLGFDSIAFEKGIAKSEADLKKLSNAMDRQGKKLQALGGKLSIGLTAPIAALAGKGIQKAREQAAAMAQVEASLASMGPVAGRTAAELEKAASALEKQSLFEADVILKDVTANLLTFGNIAGDQFDRAGQAAVDMATKLGKGPREAAVQVGKALNDPIRGVTALADAGVQFSDKQRAMIDALVETGQTAEAQEIILAELEKQFAGSAAAAQAADPVDRLNDSWNAMAETVGTKLLPALTPLVEKLGAMLDWFTNLPGPVQNVTLGALALGAALGPVLAAFGTLLRLAAGVKALVTFSAGLTGIGVASGTAAGGATAAGVAFRAMLGPIGLVIAAASALYLAWKNWDKITEIAKRLYVGVKTWVMDKLGAVFNWLKGKLGAVGDLFQRLYIRVVGNSYIPDMVDEIGQHMRRLGSEMVAPAADAIDKVDALFKGLEGTTQALIERLFPDEAATRAYRADLATIEAAYRSGALAAEDYLEAQRRLFREFAFGDARARPGTTPGFEDPGSLVKGGSFDLLPELPALAKRASGAMKELQAAGVAAFGKLGDELKSVLMGFQSIGDALKNLASRLADLAFDFAFNSLGKGLGIPGYARGTDFARGGLSLVGERGPELVNLRRGAQVFDNPTTMGMLGGVNMTVYANDAGSFHRSERQIVRAMRRRMA